MSRKEEYLAQARRAEALAQRITDPFTRDTIAQAARSWRLLASLEDERGPEFYVPRESAEASRNRTA